MSGAVSVGVYGRLSRVFSGLVVAQMPHMQKLQSTILICLSLSVVGSTSYAAPKSRVLSTSKTKVAKIKKSAASQNKLRVQLTHLRQDSKGTGFHLTHYYNQAKPTRATTQVATLGTIHSRLSLTTKRALEYLPGVWTQHTKNSGALIQLHGFTTSSTTAGAPGDGPKYTLRDGSRAVPILQQSNELEIVKKVIEHGLTLGDVKIYLHAPDMGDRWHADVQNNKAFIEFSGKKKARTEWIPAPVAVSEIVKSVRTKLKKPSLSEKVLNTMSGKETVTLSHDTIVKEVSKELGL